MEVGCKLWLLRAIIAEDVKGIAEQLRDGGELGRRARILNLGDTTKSWGRMPLIHELPRDRLGS